MIEGPPFRLQKFFVMAIRADTSNAKKNCVFYVDASFLFFNYVETCHAYTKNVFNVLMTNLTGH